MRLRSMRLLPKKPEMPFDETPFDETFDEIVQIFKFIVWGRNLKLWAEQMVFFWVSIYSLRIHFRFRMHYRLHFLADNLKLCTYLKRK